MRYQRSSNTFRIESLAGGCLYDEASLTMVVWRLVGRISVAHEARCIIFYQHVVLQL